MANNVFIYNGALEGATAGINERWLTSVNASDYAAIKNTVANFADTVDSFIPTDPTMTSADGGLMQSICAAVLSNRFLKITDNITQIAHVVVALYEAIRPELLPELTVTITSDQVINLSTVPGVTVTNALNNLETQIAGLGTDDIANDSDLPGTTLTDALDDIAPATGSDPGYVARYAYVNAASARVGTTFAGVTLLAAIAGWTTVADIVPGSVFQIDVFGAGGGGAGGSGSGLATQVCGASAGGGGAHNRQIMSREEIIEGLPIPFTLPLGGIGSNGASGAGQAVAGNDPLSQFAGFGDLVRAYCGRGGPAGASTITSAAGGSGGGIASMGTTNATAALTIGGEPGGTTANNPGWGGAGTAAGTTTGIAGGGGMWGGGAGAGRGSHAGGASTSAGGGPSIKGAAGGGAGGGFNGTVPPGGVPKNGGNGGSTGNGSFAAGTGVAGGNATIGGAGLPGANGLDGTLERGGGGGGGGGMSYNASGGALGGNGGDGGFPGGGGGGGGSASSAGANGGIGGDGGDSCIVITVLS